MTPERFITWLQRFGYLSQGTPNDADIAAAVSRMQQVYGLQPTGQITPATLRASRLFRCSHQDNAITAADTAGTGVNTTLPSTINPDCRWKKQQVTYAIGDSFSEVGGDDYKAIVRKGFTYYAPLCGLNFVEVDFDVADIQVLASPALAQSSLPGNVLAISNLPYSSVPVPLKSTFDAEEAWTSNAAGPGVVFQAVWMHELGHLLGLTHSANPNDIMSPFYTPDLLYPQRGDKQRLSLLYNIPFIETPDATGTLSVGAYSFDGIMVVRHDGGIALNLKNVMPAD